LGRWKKGLGTTTTNEFQKEKKEKASFNWSKYLDPKNDEFFKEGDYTPPKPFMELARNPSDKNISNWITYNKKKNALNQRLQLRMREYLTQTNQLSPKVVEVIKSHSTNENTKFDPSRYRIRMFFDSKCPHCKRMFQTLASLQEQGIYVEALQTDELNISKSSFPIPVRKASKDEIKKHNITAVPITLIADLKKKVLYPPVRGFQSLNSMTALIKEGEKL
jgi:thiol-disulfide isomerase/thioredoxin